MEDYDYIVSDHSSNDDVYYSDQVDSEIEAELYGLIHHDAQDNSISLQDKSNSVVSESISLNNKPDFLENESVSLHNKSGSSEIYSVLQQNNLGSKVDKSKSPLTNLVPSKDTLNSAKKRKKSVKKSKRNSVVSELTSHKNLFCSDTIANNTLYTSFESPVKEQIIQSKKGQSNISKRNSVDKPVKRKSDVVSEILGNIQSKRNMKSTEPENSFSKQKKKNQNHDSIMEEELSFVEVIDDSSDSDTSSSIILLEPDKSNIETNILKETVVLSSDAEDSDSSIEKSFSKACQRKQTAIARANFTPNNNDPWHINSDDKFRTRKYSGRYHEKAVLTCSRCQLKGHSAKFCSVPKAMKCFFCGSLHSGNNCKNKICTKCFHQGHSHKYCYMHYKKLDICELCRMRGHSERNCPDLWRRYHLTTSKGTIVKGNPNPHSPLYCYNCGTKDHFGAECMENHADRRGFPTWTSVVSYKNPKYVFQRKEENNFFQKREENYSQERRYPDRIFSPRKKKGNKAKAMDTPTNQQNIRTKKKKKSKTPTSTNHQSQTVQPNYMVQSEVYFPRTPKTTPNTSIVNSSGRKIRKRKRKEENLLRKRLLHQIELQGRHGFPSTV